MSDGRVRRFLRRLRAFAPYVLVEVLLPGGTLLALLLWLSQRFNGTGFGRMHQYLSAQVSYKAVIAAKPHAHNKPLCDRCEMAGLVPAGHPVLVSGYGGGEIHDGHGLIHPASLGPA